MLIKNNSQEYQVGKLVAKTQSYRLYLCSMPGAERTYLLQVAAEVAQNGDLDKAAYFLRSLLQNAEELEREFARLKTDPKEKLNYQLCFPELVDSFISDSQGGRRVNVLGFQNVPDVSTLVPLHNIIHKDHMRVDLKTSVWIMGKLLKILDFAHSAGISIGQLTPGNILIEPTNHYVVIFNWAKAHEGVTRDLCREEIRTAAQSVVQVLGGIQEKSFRSTEAATYQLYLLGLMRNGERSAKQAHEEFYELVDGLWPRGYHPFTVLPQEMEDSHG